MVQNLPFLFRQFGYQLVEQIEFVQGDDRIAPSGGTEVFAMNERKCGLNVPYTSSVIIIRLGLSFLTILTMRAIVSGLSV